LEDTLERLCLVDARRCVFFADCSMDEALEFLGAIGLERDYEMYQQAGGDLGERMWNAQRALPGARSAVFLGADTPSLPLSVVREALAQLRRTPVVLGPVPDGGYYLLGTTEPRPELLRGIEWGSERVLEQTTDRMPEADYLLLPKWYDVDTFSDLKHLYRDLRRSDRGGEGFPERTFSFLESLGSRLT